MRGLVQLSFYTPSQLESASGTLFGLHLRRDGFVLVDRDGFMAGIIASLSAPSSKALQVRVHQFSPVLDSSAIDLHDQLSGVVRVARYLLRTALYAEALAGGTPCFSVRELSERRQEPDLTSLLSSHRSEQDNPSLSLLGEIRRRLEASLGQPLLKNEWGSLAAMAVGAWTTDRQLSNLTALCMSADGAEVDYAALPKVLL